MGNRRVRYEVKRKFERIHFEHPIPGRLGDQPVHVIDLALGGARVLVPYRFNPGTKRELKIEWERKTIRANCTVTRCMMQTVAKSEKEKSVYEVGVHIDETVGDSHIVMREMMASFIMRALEEQKANWEGVPPIGPYLHLEGKSDRY